MILLLPAIFLAACSPKVRQVVQVPAVKTEEPKPIEKKVDTIKVVEKLTVKTAYIPSIALLLPFALDQIDQSASTKNQIKTNIAIDFYEGFKLALDSLSSNGQSFKLTVFDTHDEESQAQNLALNPAVRKSDLVVGPVFPAGVQAFSAKFNSLHKLVVSPLSAASPAGYNNPTLITLTPPLEFHAMRVAQYIKENINPKIVYVLRSGYSEENKYILPFKKTLDSLSKNHIKIVDVAITKGDFTQLLPTLSKTSENIFVIPSTQRSFLTVTLASLYALSDIYPIQLFGHPNWSKANYLTPEMLDKMHTFITSAYQVNFKLPNVVTFIKNFRKTYHTEPTEYAIKGFDTGMYFGKFLANPSTDFSRLQNVPADPLHNRFEFMQKKGYGWINRYVELLQYEDYSLKPVK